MLIKHCIHYILVWVKAKTYTHGVVYLIWFAFAYINSSVSILMIYAPIAFGAAPQALWQSYDCPPLGDISIKIVE